MTNSKNWLISDEDGSWHALDTSSAIALTDEQLAKVDEEHGGELNDYLWETSDEVESGTLVVWEEAVDALRLALSAHGIGALDAEAIIATASDAIDNNS